MKRNWILIVLAGLLLTAPVQASIVTLEMTVNDGTVPVSINVGDPVTVKIYGTVTENNGLVHRILKPGGKLVLWETNKSWLAQIIRRTAQSHDRFSDTHSSFADLPFLVAEHFAVRQVRYQGYLAYPLFGFPDVTNFAKYMPLKSWVFWATFKLDEFLGRLPLIRKMAFAVRIRAQKPASAR